MKKIFNTITILVMMCLSLTLNLSAQETTLRYDNTYTDECAVNANSFACKKQMGIAPSRGNWDKMCRTNPNRPACIGNNGNNVLSKLNNINQTLTVNAKGDGVDPIGMFALLVVICVFFIARRNR